MTRPVQPGEPGQSAALGDTTAAEQIFVSHSSQDVVAAREIRRFLESHGYRTWMAPESLRGRTSWVDQILAAVADCPAMVVVLSQHTSASEHVAREVSLALDARKTVIPVRVAPVELSGSLNYLLHLVQWVDAFPPPLDRHAQPLLQRLANTDLEPTSNARPTRPDRACPVREVWCRGAGGDEVLRVVRRRHGGPAPVVGVRKTVTAVFCDVTGSTALGQRLDPETLRGLMEAYFATVSEALVRHGGTVEKFVGDAVMAVFGVPVAHEDDALRACRAALEMLAAVADVDRRSMRAQRVPLEVRIGVETGEVVVGDPGGAARSPRVRR